MEKLAVELSTEMTFRRAARIMNFLVPEVSPMTIWGACVLLKPKDPALPSTKRPSHCQPLYGSGDFCRNQKENHGSSPKSNRA